jgi:uncharacterized RDD family membrane protein YckC
MATSSTQRDPRGIVTPDAFDVSAELLGMPLASPGRRFVALLIDLAVIGVVTAVTRSFALVLGVVAAALFVRAGFRRTEVKGSVFARAMRFSVGCLGVFIAVITSIVWASCGTDFGQDERAPRVTVRTSPGSGSAAGRIIGALASAGVMRAFDDVETIEEAEVAALSLIELSAELGIADEEVRDFLSGAVPDDAPWAAQSDDLFDRLLSPGAETVALPDGESAQVQGYSTEEALEAYAGVLRRGAATDEDPERRALEARLAQVVAGDTLTALADRIAGLERANREQQSDLEDATAALERADSGGVFGWLREFVDELGFGFGWASLYLTVILSAWKGQTVGKRVMRIRVLRLDGQPITWWTAFERAGGYAAGFATGLLGFAQVYWDANRQTIHDRIVGTVVVIDGAEKMSAPPPSHPAPQ